MTATRSPYAGHTIVFATMHGKERLAAGSFAELLGAAVVAPDHLDTDQLGTFAGDIPRTLSPRTAASVKARLGMQITGLPCALASEGSFRSSLVGTHTTEVLLFVDVTRGIEIVETASGSSPLPPGRRVESVSEALAYAQTVGFPDQGVILHVRRGAAPTIHKTIGTVATLAEVVEDGLARGATVTILTDHRAHRSPSRADRIRRLCARMAERIATACPVCGTPGYGIIRAERGVPCALCGTPTSLIAADVHGCCACPTEDRRARAVTQASPAECDRCNP